ncbi:type 2 DNA topoisomerase 6 subunit B-like isoform X2 [Peromyscus leucopus]|uniref:type 2 DNA topoisomerase 6 subunit B-like isoform X2 n=1 Tax=Peromyscus leucopus TaxID=10041 RepID=UPI0018857F00|nr:type 2 DNA topoisomerase 6 subunit B-like isoform X2 [Peromyscus leucopus]
MDPNILILLGLHTLLTAHLSAILSESRSPVRDSIQSAVDQVLERHHQAVQAADTQEFGTKLHRIFYDATQHRLRSHCSCDTEQHSTPEKRHSAQSTEGWHENIGPESLVETSGQAENKKLKRSPNQGREESQALCPARDLSPPESATGHHESTVASPNARGSQAQAAPGRVPAADAASPAGGLEDLWLQEVSNLSEWLSPGRRF